MDAPREDIGTRDTDAAQPPQTEQKHPPEYRDDLNPDRMAGQNVGTPQAGLPNAYDTKEVHNALSGFSDDELKQIPLVREGERLKQGATYLNLRDRARGEFTATAEMEAGAGDWIVPKDAVPYPTWNRLRGITDPERAT